MLYKGASVTGRPHTGPHFSDVCIFFDITEGINLIVFTQLCLQIASFTTRHNLCNRSLAQHLSTVLMIIALPGGK